MSKEKHPDDLELPDLFDTDEPLFLDGLGDKLQAPVLTYEDLIAMGGTGGGGSSDGDGGAADSGSDSESDSDSDGEGEGEGEGEGDGGDGG